MFCLPSTLVFNNRRMYWKFDFSPVTSAVGYIHPSVSSFNYPQVIRALLSSSSTGRWDRIDVHMMGDLKRVASGRVEEVLDDGVEDSRRRRKKRDEDRTHTLKMLLGEGRFVVGSAKPNGAWRGLAAAFQGLFA